MCVYVVHRIINEESKVIGIYDDKKTALRVINRQTVPGAVYKIICHHPIEID